MCSDDIFQILLSSSRPMMSHHVTCHVTAMSRASSSSLKEKEKEIQKKRNIKSRKIDKRKRKMLVSEAFHNTKSTSCDPNIIALVAYIHKELECPR